MFISSCDAVTGPDAIAGNGDLALSASRSSVKVGVTYHITTVDDLIAVNKDPAGDYILDNDLTLKDWVPICDPSNKGVAFTGTFDGQNNTITVNSFSLDAVNSEYLGIFAVLGSDEGDPSVSNLNVDFVPGPISSKTVQYVGGVSGYARDTAFSDITITGTFDITSGNSVSLPNFNVGGVSGFAAGSTFDNVQVYANFAGTFYGPPPPPPSAWEIWRGDDTLHFRRGFGQAVPGEDGLAIGGVAGYAKTSTFRDAIVRGSIDATGVTVASPVYAGGVVGSANTSTVDDSHTVVTITGEAPGYNSSAGGVAGYILGTTVSDSSATGKAVSLTGPSDTYGWSDSWQVYAGGLVGYAGGTDTTASRITGGFASSDVFAYSPFPYAGGLVGYNYGYNDFTNPAKNGTVITKSYATGAVYAESLKDPSEAYGDIPYAGGLVGYSSVAGSRIEDSYARGSATATTQGTYAWAGGIVGGNANNSVILRVYATGNVSSYTGTLEPLYAPQYADAGPAAGGIAGFNYYSANTSISDSFALNGKVDGDQTNAQDVVHRVAGSLGNTSGYIGLLENNRAYDKMTLPSNWKQEIGLDRRDGGNTAAVPAKDVYAAQGWKFGSVWDIGSDGYPILVEVN
jgi:hypothetical protein